MVVPATVAVAVARRWYRRWRHPVPAFVPLLPPTVLLSPAQTFAFLPFSLPLRLLCLHLGPLFFPLAVPLLSLHHPTLPKLLLFFPVERVAFVVVTAGTESAGHLVQLVLLCCGNAMCVRWLQPLSIDVGVGFSKQLRTERSDLLLNLIFIHTRTKIVRTVRDERGQQTYPSSSNFSCSSKHFTSTFRFRSCSRISASGSLCLGGAASHAFARS